jgi:hypothetical protein
MDHRIGHSVPTARDCPIPAYEVRTIPSAHGREHEHERERGLAARHSAA